MQEFTQDKSTGDKSHLFSGGSYKPSLETMEKIRSIRTKLVSSVPSEVKKELHNQNKQLFEAELSIHGNRLMNDIYEYIRHKDYTGCVKCEVKQEENELQYA